MSERTLLDLLQRWSYKDHKLIWGLPFLPLEPVG